MDPRSHMGTIRGRPRKFSRPSRPVTVTLPDDVLARLCGIDPDLGRAIVAAVERKKAPATPIRAAELANYGKHAVIVITPLKTLKRLPGVELVPITNGRCLIALQHPYSTANLELDIRDVVERNGAEGNEREALEAIADILRRARADPNVSLEERTIIVLESGPTRGRDRGLGASSDGTRSPDRRAVSYREKK